MTAYEAKARTRMAHFDSLPKWKRDLINEFGAERTSYVFQEFPYEVDKEKARTKLEAERAHLQASWRR